MFYEALGMNADNFSAGLFQAHNPCAFAGGNTSFIDCLMARLLEGGSPEVEALFRTNPFAGAGGTANYEGAPPPLLRMRVFLYEPCRDVSSGDWWTRRDIGPQRPVMARKDVAKIWAGLLPEPELWHWDQVYWRERCAARVCSDVTDVGLLVPRAIHFESPRSSYIYDGTKLQETAIDVSKSDVTSFWEVFVPLVREHRDNLCAAAVAARNGSEFPSNKLSTYEIILSRLSWNLTAQLQPLVFSITPKATPDAATTAGTEAAAGPAPAEQLGSFFDMSLLCHHIILGGEASYHRALEQPAGTLHAVMPLVASGADAWCACTPPATMAEDAEEEEEDGGGQQRLSAASGFVLWAVLRYEVLCLHATKFRLNKQTCAPNNISSSVENAGFFELFDHIAAVVTLPSTLLEK